MNRSLGQPVVTVTVAVACRTLSIRAKTSIHESMYHPGSLAATRGIPCAAGKSSGWAAVVVAGAGMGGSSAGLSTGCLVGTIRLFSIVRERKREGDDWKAVDRIRSSQYERMSK